MELMLSNAGSEDPVRHINTTIDMLLQINATVRPRLSADRYERARKLELHPDDERDFRVNDIGYIDENFESMDFNFREKVLAANMERRKILKYTHERFMAFRADDATAFLLSALPSIEHENSADLGDIVMSSACSGGDTESIATRAEDITLTGLTRRPSYAASTISSLFSVSFSFKGRVFSFPKLEVVDDDDGENNNVEDDDRFQTCPACYLYLPFDNERQWR